MSSTAHEERLADLLKLVTRLHSPHTIEVRLYEHEVGVVSLTLGTTGSVGV